MLIIIVILLLPRPAYALDTPAPLGALGVISPKLKFEARELVDAPTAGMRHRGQFGLRLASYPSDGLLAEMNLGVATWGEVGVSYGATRLFGDGRPGFNPRLEVNAKLRVLNEDWVPPALVVGVNTQGWGAYLPDKKRFMGKSKGLYVAASKNFDLAGLDWGLHVGINRSFETGDGDGDLDLWLGTNLDIVEQLSLVAEYDPALNDNGKTQGLNRAYEVGRFSPCVFPLRSEEHTSELQSQR